MGSLIKRIDKEVRRFTGVQDQIDASNRNTDAQIAATERAANAQEQQARDAAKATADAQAQMAERQKVEEQVKALAAQTQEVADVSIGPQQQGSTIGAARKRRAKFGTGNTGAYIP